MSPPHIAAVMIHVPNISEAMAWYERVFLNAQRSSTDEEEFEFLLVGEVRLELVLADQKVSSGPSGSARPPRTLKLEQEQVRGEAAA